MDMHTTIDIIMLAKKDLKIICCDWMNVIACFVLSCANALVALFLYFDELCKLHLEFSQILRRQLLYVWYVVDYVVGYHVGNLARGLYPYGILRAIYAGNLLGVPGNSST